MIQAIPETLTFDEFLDLTAQQIFIAKNNLARENHKLASR